jgi:hypothetical protein
MRIVWKAFEDIGKENRKEDYVEIINGNTKLINELRNKMIELENRGRKMKS